MLSSCRHRHDIVLQISSLCSPLSLRISQRRATSRLLVKCLQNPVILARVELLRLLRELLRHAAWRLLQHSINFHLLEQSSCFLIQPSHIAAWKLKLSFFGSLACIWIDFLLKMLKRRLWYISVEALVDRVHYQELAWWFVMDAVRVRLTHHLIYLCSCVVFILE